VQARGLAEHPGEPKKKEHQSQKRCSYFCLTACNSAAPYKQMLPWRSNTAANHIESAATAAIAC